MSLIDDLDAFIVVDDGDDEPILCWKDGREVDTWREGYPYQHRFDQNEYERTKRQLQIELLKLQNYLKESGRRMLVIFEGRDTAGKGGTIKRFMEHLNPGGPGWWLLKSPTSASGPSGTSNATSPIFPPAARSSSSIDRGTTVPVSSG